MLLLHKKFTPRKLYIRGLYPKLEISVGVLGQLHPLPETRRALLLLQGSETAAPRTLRSTPEGSDFVTGWYVLCRIPAVLSRFVPQYRCSRLHRRPAPRLCRRVRRRAP